MADFDYGPGDDNERGTGDSDLMNGNAGNDVLKGLGGGDDIFGGLDNDTLFGNAGGDLLKGEQGNDKLVGGAGNDVLFGGAGRDKLLGGDGLDFLNGDAGNATLTGGAGGDNFQVDAGAKRVVITDFELGVDTLLIDSSFYPGITVQQLLTKHGSSSGGDSAIDLSGNGADFPRIILLGVDNAFDMANDINLI